MPGLVGHVRVVERVRFAWRQPEVDVDIAVVLVGHVGHRPDDCDAPVLHLEPGFDKYVWPAEDFWPSGLEIHVYDGGGSSTQPGFRDKTPVAR